MEMKTVLREFDILTANQFLASPSNTYFAKVSVEDDETYGQLEVYKGSDPGHAEGKWIWRTHLSGPKLEKSTNPIFFCFTGPLIFISSIEQDSLDQITRQFIAAGEDERRTTLDQLSLHLGHFGVMFSGDTRLKYHLTLQDDGNLVVRQGEENDPGDPVWSSLVELNTESEPPVVKGVKQTWLEKAKYDEMKFCETRILLSFGNDKYVLMQANKIDPEAMPIEIGEVLSGVQVTKNFLGPSFAIIAAASIIHAGATGSSDLSSVNFSLFNPGAKAEISSTFIGAGASLNLIDGQVSVFNLTLGLGADTGLGIKDDSVTLEALGCGFQLGRVVSVSVFGSSFGVDFGRVFNSIF